jgi:hypothetical protein
MATADPAATNELVARVHPDADAPPQPRSDELAHREI